MSQDELHTVAWFTNTKKDGTRAKGAGDSTTNEEYATVWSEWHWEPLVLRSAALARIEALERERDAALANLDAALSLHNKTKAERDAALTDAKVQRGFAELWYFVMDEKPMEFERIVTTYTPAQWLNEASKLRAIAQDQP